MSIPQVTLPSDIPFLERAIDLAHMAYSAAYPNPKVGAVIVHNGRIIGEGFHRKSGGPHAEVAAVNSVKDADRHLLAEATIYVSLEPCNHFGKTPPCVNLILDNKIPTVVIGATDPNPKVAGKGIARLIAGGCEVRMAPNPAPFEETTFIFFHNQREKRPWISLKWAQSADGYIAEECEKGEYQPVALSSPMAKTWVHKLRAVHDSIMIGRKTATVDSPSLNVRENWGKHPLRIVWDRHGKLSKEAPLFTDGNPTLVIQEEPVPQDTAFVSYISPSQWEDVGKICQELFKHKKVSSILVEGGTNLLQQFIDQGVFDEILVQESPRLLHKGLAAPTLPSDITCSHQEQLGDTRVTKWIPKK